MRHAEASRRRLLDRVVAIMMICGSHFPGPDLPKSQKMEQLRAETCEAVTHAQRAKWRGSSRGNACQPIHK